MVQVPRVSLSEIDQKLKPNKVLIIYGARRVGKTELLKAYLKKKTWKYLLLNGEDDQTLRLLDEQSVSNYQRLVAGLDLLVIDEAQNISAIGSKLKLMVDEIEGIRILVTGSSALDLDYKMGEPLVGRKQVILLHPLAQMEYSVLENFKETLDNQEERLIYGGYPELVHLKRLSEKQEYLNDLVSAYLLKEILALEGIRKSGKLMDLLRLIAFQIGQEVSVEELANQLKGISRNTVEQYLDLLSNVFIIYKIGGYSNNLRKEVTKNSRWYFVDNGIRNAIIQNFNPLNLRNDHGQLWENYVLSERIKYQHYSNLKVENYFWRTYDQQEIDWVEYSRGKLSGTEIKWNEKKARKKPPVAWTKAYPDANFQTITPADYLDWVT